MAILTCLWFGLLGGAIGSVSTWLYMMRKHAGRPIDWTVIGLTFALTMALGGALLMQR